MVLIVYILPRIPWYNHDTNSKTNYHGKYPKQNIAVVFNFDIDLTN